MKIQSIKNLIIATLLTLSLTAIASSNILNLWVNDNESGYSYMDRLYEDGEVEIITTKDESSENEDALSISVTLTKKMGSRSQKNYYIGKTFDKAPLPLKVNLKKANIRGRVTRDRIKGQLVIENGDKEGIQGTLFGEKIDALSQPLF